MLHALALMRWAIPMPMGGWAVLPWAEIKAFGEATGRLATPWEYETAAEMSAAYVRGLSEGRNIMSIMPMDRSD